MNRRLRLGGWPGAVSLLLAALVLVAGANLASYEGTGHGFLLGRTNKANRITTMQRTTSEPALALKTTRTSALPITTNAPGKITHLNADEVDGEHKSAFAAHAPIAAGFVYANGSLERGGVLPCRTGREPPVWSIT